MRNETENKSGILLPLLYLMFRELMPLKSTRISKSCFNQHISSAHSTPALQHDSGV
jgi:hypothetical protein